MNLISQCLMYVIEAGIPLLIIDTLLASNPKFLIKFDLKSIHFGVLKFG